MATCAGKLEPLKGQHGAAAGEASRNSLQLLGKLLFTVETEPSLLSTLPFLATSHATPFHPRNFFRPVPHPDEDPPTL